MDSGQVADLAIFICCVLMLLGYTFFYFEVRIFTIPLTGKSYANLYGLNRQARSDWVRYLSRDAKEGISATVRNQCIVVSILAAATASIASQVINVMTDAARLEQVRHFATVDPITDNGLISPPIKLGISLGLLFLSIMALAQSVRLSVHLGYTIRVVAEDPARYAGLGRLAVTLMRRSTLYFAIGLRFLFAVGPLLVYLLGPTALLIATLMDIAAQFLFDVVPAADAYDPDEEVSEGAPAAHVPSSAPF